MKLIDLGINHQVYLDARSHVEAGRVSFFDFFRNTVVGFVRTGEGKAGYYPTLVIDKKDGKLHGICKCRQSWPRQGLRSCLCPLPQIDRLAPRAPQPLRGLRQPSHGPVRAHPGGAPQSRHIESHHQSPSRPEWSECGCTAHRPLGFFPEPARNSTPRQNPLSRQPRTGPAISPRRAC